MSIFDEYEYKYFLYPNDDSLSSEEEKERQDQLCELMYEYQRYQGIIEIQKFVSRGSKLVCQYGTRNVLLDCLEDYGICQNCFPFLTTRDCRSENINNFGSCLCPEEYYRERLPMTAAIDKIGIVAQKASCNELPHICVPLIDEEHGWRQIDEDLLVAVNAQEYAPMLLDNAVLVCQYGGIITIAEVPETEESTDSSTNEKYVVIAKVLKVRSGPSIEEEEIGELYAGDRVYVIDSSRKKEVTKDGERLWAKIEYKNEDEGWVADSYILPDQDVVTEKFPERVYINKNGEWTTNKLTLGIYGGGVYKNVKEKTGERYNIAVGPKIMNPKYPDDGKIEQADFMAFTREIDVVVRHKITKKEKVILCYEYDVKAHSYNKYPDKRFLDAYNKMPDDKVIVKEESGLFQTGIRYPYATNAEEYAVNNVDMSVIEFCNPSTGGINCDDYELVKVIAYLQEE